jgi:hypothetical protein
VVLLHGIVLGVLLWLACVLQPIVPPLVALLPFAVLASWWLATLDGWETR